MRKTIAGVGIVAGLAAALAVTAGPAMAAPGDGFPESNEFITYLNTGRGGALYDFASDAADYSGYFFINTDSSVNDNVSSVTNNSRDRRVQAYVDPHLSGPSVSVLRFGQAAGTVSWTYDPVPFDERLSSHRFIR